MVDSIALNYLRSKSKTGSIKWRFIYALEPKRLLNYEKKCVELFDKVNFVNKEVAEYFSSLQKFECILNGIDERLLCYESSDEFLEYRNHMVFFGKMDYQPNIDAVLWFINKVLPNLHPEIRLIIVGSNLSPIIKRLEKKNKRVVVTGYLEDPYGVNQSSLRVVSPTLIGGGIQNKILESMAFGTVNIVSTLASKPIGAVNERDFLVTDDPIEMAKIINDI